MTIAIIGAMDEEVELLKSKLDERQDSEMAGVLFHEGTLNDKPVVLLRSGIGKVNAAIGTTLLLKQYKADMVINTGAAGGFNEKLNVGDIVISTEVRYNDVDATVFGYEFGQVPQMPPNYEADQNLITVAKEAAERQQMTYEEGLIVSGDSFMSDDDKVQFLKETFKDPQCAEMEAGAIAQVCYRFNVPFVIIRSLSDVAGQDAKLTYDQFLDKASVQSANLVMEIVRSL